MKQKIDEQGNPVLDEKGEPVMVNEEPVYVSIKVDPVVDPVQS